MGIKKIEPSWTAICDRCGAFEEGCKSANRPHGWAEIKMMQEAEDYQGSPIADASFGRLVCRTCREEFTRMFNIWLKEGE